MKYWFRWKPLGCILCSVLKKKWDIDLEFVHNLLFWSRSMQNGKKSSNFIRRGRNETINQKRRNYFRKSINPEIHPEWPWRNKNDYFLRKVLEHGSEVCFIVYHSYLETFAPSGTPNVIQKEEISPFRMTHCIRFPQRNKAFFVLLSGTEKGHFSSFNNFVRVSLN